MTRSIRLIVAAALAAVLLTGCAPAVPAAQHSPKAPAPARTPVPVAVQPSAGTVATATGSEIVALDAPRGAEVATFKNPIAAGSPATFLVVTQKDGWIQVKLPIRPNGSTGWVPASAVSLATVHYSLDVSTSARTVTLLQDGSAVRTFSAAIGTGDTPTPLGSFYLTELLAPTNAGYGPYAYGISAFSDVLNSFGGGPGQIGMHGTDDRSSIGQAASHGCIRLSNEDITYLAGMLPLGTPITIS